MIFKSSNNMTFEKLFHATKNGRVKQWEISVEERILHPGQNPVPTIVIKTGLVEGKQTVFEINIFNGKNIGRANETSALQQARLDAMSKWSSKIKMGYSTNKKGPESSEGPVYPMLATDYNKFSSKMQFPCFAQPKLDGIRATYNFKNKQMYSRNLIPFNGLQHITNEIKSCDFILDGELYSDELPFQKINGIVRKETLSETDLKTILKIQFRVYDIVTDKPFKDRNKMLSDWFSKNNFQFIKMVKTTSITKENVNKTHDAFVAEGYEGLILRNKESIYEKDTRSYNLQKFKKFDDSEFKIIGFKEGVGKEAGAVIWICEVTNAPTREESDGVAPVAFSFDTRPKGTILERKKIFKEAKDHPEKYIGKYITVVYFGFTDKGIPRFPIAQAIREFGSNKRVNY